MNERTVIMFHVYFHVQIQTKFIGRFSKICSFVCSLHYVQDDTKKFFCVFFFGTNKFNLQCDFCFFLCCWLSEELMKVCFSWIKIFAFTVYDHLMECCQEVAKSCPPCTRIDALMIDIRDLSSITSKQTLLHSNDVFVYFKDVGNKNLPLTQSLDFVAWHKLNWENQWGKHHGWKLYSTKLCWTNVHKTNCDLNCKKLMHRRSSTLPTNSAL